MIAYGCWVDVEDGFESVDEVPTRILMTQGCTASMQFKEPWIFWGKLGCVASMQNMDTGKGFG
eukprot:365372-Chlamydomonas_euryale.AAC.8